MKKNNVFVCGIFAVAMIVVLAFTACSQPSDNSGSVAVTGVTLNKESLSLTVGSTEPLTATVQPSNASNQNVSWSSSNTSVATVSNGTVTAVAAGSATITVTTADGSKTATCAVTVTSGEGVISGNTIVSGADVIYDSSITNQTEAKSKTDFGYNFWHDYATNTDEIIQLSVVLDDSTSVTVNDSKVTIILGTPKSDYLNSSEGVEEGVTVTPNDAKVFQISDLCTSDKKYRLVCTKDSDIYGNSGAYLIYADKDVTIKGTYTDDNVIYDVSLKKGWNYLLGLVTDSTTKVTSSTTLPTGYKWTVFEDN